ncbi:MAG: rhamnulokinase [Actinomycetia bacterium]|jgi:rhamnulokinase|nr:rhamnulokinase [Actinomycetes bacterium]
MRVLAVDLGATSVRVVAVDLGAPEPAAQVLHRWRHQPVRHQDGSLRWDWHGIVREVERGLELGLAAGPVASIGVDGWGVDYGLLDRRGALLSPPYCYRDERTEGWRTTAERIGADHLYAVTGIQLLHLNTIFQLAAHDRSELRHAARLLLLPDLVVRMLTGFEGAERSNASTTALLDAETGAWSAELLEAVGLDPALLPPIVSAGLAVGSWRGVDVHTVGSHDTASAFVGVPGVPGPGSVVVSSGTWVLVGAERPAADTSEKARDANFSNEAGALGGVRFLKNVTGFWLLEQCRAAWGNPTIEELVAAAAGVPATRVVDPADARFLAPTDMEAEIRAAAGLGAAASRAEVVRCILESIASATARVADELVAVTGTPVDELLVVGGAARIRVMNELYGRHAGVPVTVGSPEATALGNAVVQGLALGQFERLEDARRWLAIGAERLLM